MPLAALPDAGSHRARCRPLRCEPANPATSALFALANGNMAASHASATEAAYALEEKLFQLAGGTVPATAA
jgi:hypothetical protein